jgi:hypothetical protein
LADNVGKIIVPALKTLTDMENRGLDTSAQRQKVLDLIHHQSNLVAKAQTELLIVGDRAHALLLEKEKAITKDKVVTDAELRRAEDMSDSYRSLQRPTQWNNDVAELLLRLRAQAAETK